MVKLVKGEAEDAKISVRNVRRDANEALKKLLKDKVCSEDEERRSQDEIQKLTDKFVADIDKIVVDKEKEIFSAQALESGKPADIVAKMVEGRIKKFLNEVSLVGQPFVKNPDMTVGQLLKNHNAIVTSFIRFEVGEGIEKQADNFVEEVMAQARA
jgi:hypothetical protein